jgi:hypothetical protein
MLTTQTNRITTRIQRKPYEHWIVMIGGRACPTDSARARSLHHIFETITQRRIRTGTYGNLFRLKSSTQGGTEFSPSVSPLPQRASNTIRNVSRTRNTKINWCFKQKWEIDNEYESNGDDPNLKKRQRQSISQDPSTKSQQKHALKGNLFGNVATVYLI